MQIFSVEKRTDTHYVWETLQFLWILSVKCVNNMLNGIDRHWALLHKEYSNGK